MLKQFRKSILVIMVVAILVVASIALSSCAGKENDGYRKFVLREGSVHFSFEYPFIYTEPFVDFSARMEVPSITSELRPSEEVMWDSVFTIDAFKVDEQHNAQTYLESSLQLFEEGIFRDYKLLERAPITVAGLPGEQILFSYTAVPDYYHGMKGEPTPYMTRSIYFNYKGFYWLLGVDSRMDKWEESQTYFEHLLETFKFLD